ncbi:MAG: ribonuclease E/G [Lachnospiraceae bacterium]|nr:ribonuclease E/G [Lachnospiraceae bacterium]
MGKLIVTPYEGGVLSALHDGGRVRLLDWNEPGESVRCGNIYRAKVVSVSRNIQAAFADLGGVNGYLPLADGETVKPGDELTLQVEKEARGTKLAVLTRKLSLPGRYLVLLPEGRGVHYSHKLGTEDIPEAVKEVLAPYTAGCGFILRTNAVGAQPEEIESEAERLKNLADSLVIRADHSPAPALVFRGDEPYLTLLRDLRKGEAEEIVTDDPDFFREIGEWLAAHQPEDAGKLRLYDDPQLPLQALYALPAALEKALQKKVWLKSGGYLVIEPTEAMTVIDVNTGKNEGHKDFEETVFQTNLEAAEEIAVQLRLRNLCGIIVVDFINMKDEAHREALLARLAAAVAADPVHTAVEGMTKLGLVEMTRQKKSLPLEEKIPSIS